MDRPDCEDVRLAKVWQSIVMALILPCAMHVHTGGSCAADSLRRGTTEFCTSYAHPQHHCIS